MGRLEYYNLHAVYNSGMHMFVSVRSPNRWHLLFSLKLYITLFSPPHIWIKNSLIWHVTNCPRCLLYMYLYNNIFSSPHIWIRNRLICDQSPPIFTIMRTSTIRMLLQLECMFSISSDWDYRHTRYIDHTNMRILSKHSLSFPLYWSGNYHITYLRLWRIQFPACMLIVLGI